MLRENELLPTPRAGNPESRPNGKGGKILAEEIRLLPTPTATDYKGRGPNSKQVGIDNFFKTTDLDSLSYTQEYHASQLVQPESAEARQMTVGSGRKLSESYQNFSPLGRCLKTLLESPVWSNPARLFRWEVKPIKQVMVSSQSSFLTSSPILKKKDTKSSRFLFQLQALERPINDSESLLLPTPSTQEVEHPEMEITETGRRLSKNEDNSHSIGLADTVRIGLLRTPDANMERGPRSTENLIERYQVKKMPLCLNDQLAMMNKGLIPTPMATEARQGYQNRNNGMKGTQESLTTVLRNETGGQKTGLKLQPGFVLWMQGLPLDYLD